MRLFSPNGEFNLYFFNSARNLIIVADILEQRVLGLIGSVTDDLAWLEVTEDGFVASWSEAAAQPTATRAMGLRFSAITCGRC